MSKSEHHKHASKAGKSDVAMAIAWYRREEWPQLLAHSDDREKLEETYDEWLREARRFLLDMVSRGLQIEKVELGVNELLDWCRTEHRPLDAESRSSFASYKLSQRKRESDQHSKS